MRQATRAVLLVMAGAAAMMVLDRVAGASHGATASTAGLKVCATPKGHLLLAGAGGCGPGTTSAGVLAHQQSADDAFAHIGALEPKLAALEAENASLESKVSTLESNNTALQSRISELESTLAGVSRTGSVLKFEAMNLQVVNGTGTTTSSNGKGNIIIGYNQDRPDSERDATARSGSHYLVVGDQHKWTGFGGIVAGVRNTATGAYASVTGGIDNTASGDQASVSGGVNNIASGDQASVSGGTSNIASGDQAASVSGGISNIASGHMSSVTGGHSNIASGAQASVSGGLSNIASGIYSSVSGGHQRSASGIRDWRAGGVSWSGG